MSLLCTGRTEGTHEVDISPGLGEQLSHDPTWKSSPSPVWMGAWLRQEHGRPAEESWPCAGCWRLSTERFPHTCWPLYQSFPCPTTAASGCGGWKGSVAVADGLGVGRLRREGLGSGRTKLLLPHSGKERRPEVETSPREVEPWKQGEITA